MPNINKCDRNSSIQAKYSDAWERGDYSTNKTEEICQRSNGDGNCGITKTSEKDGKMFFRSFYVC